MRGERGQILLMVLAVLVIGSVVVGSLLAFLDIGLRVTLRAEENLNAYYAAEAGVDAVIADLFQGENPSSDGYPPDESLLQDDGSGNYSLEGSVHGYTVNITIAPPANPIKTLIGTYDYVGVENPCTDHCAFDCDVDYWDRAPTGWNLNYKDEASDQEYTDISTSNDVRWATRDPGGNDEVFLWLDQTIDEDGASITIIDLVFEGYSNGGTATFRIWAYNDAASTWESLGSDMSIPGGSDSTMTRSITSDFDDYISADGVLTWGVSSDATRDRMQVDYIKLEITCAPPDLYLDPGLVFWMQDIPPGGTASCSFDFDLLTGMSVEINWVLFPDAPAGVSTWELSIEKDGDLIDPPGEVTDTGSPAVLEALDLDVGNYKANFWVQNNHASKSLYTVPFISSRAGSSDYTWLKLYPGYQEYVITSTAKDDDGTEIIKITCYAIRLPGPSGWWLKQTVEIIAWQIEKK